MRLTVKLKTLLNLGNGLKKNVTFCSKRLINILFNLDWKNDINGVAFKVAL